jgi:hypothetical protein
MMYIANGAITEQGSKTMEAKINATVWDTEHTGRTRKVIADVHEAFELDLGEFLISSFQGFITIGRFTGRTRRFWHHACPTIERFEVDTFATTEGVIMGRKGMRLAGTLAIRPENTSC